MCVRGADESTHVLLTMHCSADVNAGHSAFIQAFKLLRSEKCYQLSKISFLIMGASISTRRESLRLRQNNEKSNNSVDLMSKNLEVAKPIILSALTINIR